MSKKFFRLDDQDSEYYLVVALDKDNVRDIIHNSGLEFGDPARDIDKAEKDGLVSWSELTEEAAMSQIIDASEDPNYNSRLPLYQCMLGDWFSSSF